MTKLSTVLTSVAMIATLALPLASQAKGMPDNNQNRPRTDIAHKQPMQKHGFDKNKDMKMRGISGTVTAISGTTLTITGTDASSTVYTVDAASSTVKGGSKDAIIPLSAIQVGDKINVQGTVNGTTVVAKSISDPSLNGRNLFMGKVTAVSGSTISIDSKVKGSTTTTAYTINASSSTVLLKNGTTSTISSIQVGDYLKVFGTISGLNILPTWIRDLGTAIHHGWMHGWKH